MNTTGIINAVKASGKKVGGVLKAKAPEILMATGTVAVVTGTVVACKQTIKAKDIVDQAKKDLEIVKECEENEELREKGEYTEEDAKKDKRTVIFRTGTALAKTYGPAVGLLTIGLGCMFKSHSIMTSRVGALSSAYLVLQTKFDKYRDRVKEAVGEAAEDEIFAPKKKVKVKNEEGKTEEKDVLFADPKEGWGFYFEDCLKHDDDTDINEFMANQAVEWINALVDAHNGFAFVGDLYNDCGRKDYIPQQQVFGWMEGDQIDIEVRRVLVENDEGLIEEKVYINPLNPRPIINEIGKRK